MRHMFIRSVGGMMLGLLFFSTSSLAWEPTLVVTPVSQAQATQQPAPARDETTAQNKEKIEEITVIGQREIFSLRQKITKAEDHAYDIFNKLVDDRSFAVHCQFKAPTGTLIRRRVCLPNFYYDATRDQALSSLCEIGSFTNCAAVPSARNVFAVRFPVFKNKVKELAMKNPEMLDALKKLFELNAELKRERDIYHGVAHK